MMWTAELSPLRVGAVMHLVAKVHQLELREHSGHLQGSDVVGH